MALDGDWGCLMEVLRWGSLDSFGESYQEGRRKECPASKLVRGSWSSKEGVCDTGTKASFNLAVSQHNPVYLPSIMFFISLYPSNIREMTPVHQSHTTSSPQLETPIYIETSIKAHLVNAPARNFPLQW